ncbi:hypothetical protein CEXT_593751 [Caerostris extrusa]|uniref:Uncharacterized protein n=1 Tax=Caerostris extrusa TaxID=172846 RepID=A0AAV4P2C7_CAEEX|nr:hypothetical protein CEXT_593751 [Caerostris extrusa]
MGSKALLKLANRNSSSAFCILSEYLGFADVKRPMHRDRFPQKLGTRDSSAKRRSNIYSHDFPTAQVALRNAHPLVPGRNNRFSPCRSYGRHLHLN